MGCETSRHVLSIPRRGLSALLGVIILVPITVGAQARDTTRGPPRAVVSGVVRDSIAGRPLVGADVQLVSADTAAPFAATAQSDSLGRFSFVGVAPGRYRLGFFHPVADSLGIEPPVREVTVVSAAPVRVDLAIPSASRLRAALCSARAQADSGAVLVGVVRDARTRVPVAGVTVTGIWLELEFGPQGIDRRIQSLDATTGASGWFALCNVPNAGSLALMARRGADSTDFIELDMPVARLLRRDLYLGPSRVVVTPDTQPIDSLAAVRRRRTGDGRLTGVVTAVAGGRAIPGAYVSIRDGPETRANARGEWTLVGVPLGTRVLEVRAVGYYPERVGVDVVADAGPVRTALFTMRAVLDTVTVVASRVSRGMQGFEQRRRSGVGRYITSEEIVRRRPIQTSNLFSTVPGVFLERGTLGDTRIRMRGMFADRCAPSVYVDGHYMSTLSADDIDSWIRPDEIAGIEIYRGAGTPPEFSIGLTQQYCGSIVIWTRPPLVRSRSSWKRRVVTLAGLLAVGFGIGALLR